jgi:hypothetical protein
VTYSKKNEGLLDRGKSCLCGIYNVVDMLVEVQAQMAFPLWLSGVEEK